MAGDASRRNGQAGGRPKGARNAATVAAEAGRAKALQQAEITAERTMLEIARVAFTDLRSFFAPDGTLKATHELTADQGAALASVEVIIKNAAAGDGVTDRIHKLRLWDKTRALEALAKHFGLLTDRVEHSGGILIRHELPE